MNRIYILILIAPWLLTLGFFWAFPVAYSLWLSFTDQSIFHAGTFIGLDNYIRLFQDKAFLLALKNTAFFVVGTIPFTTIIALILAVLISEKIPGHRIFRTAYFLPSITSMVVISLVFVSLYSRDGYLYTLGKMVGLNLPEHGLLFSTATALPAIMFMDIWVAIGYYVLLFLAAIASISPETIEASILDGAGYWRRLTDIILPQIKPMMLFVLVINTIRSFQIFIEIYVMTRGGPVGSTSTVVYFVYEEGLSRFNIGYASAAAYLLFAIILLLALLQMKIIERKKGMAI